MHEDETLEFIITGSVQGVGFRPFIYNLAKSHNLLGFVQNNGTFVKIIVNGKIKSLEDFSKDITLKKPPLAVIDTIDVKNISSEEHFNDFQIKNSSSTKSSNRIGYIPPDTAICDNCLDDMVRGDRKERKSYSFTSCVDCGPRYSVIKKVPYDRPFTTMDEFPFCPTCLQEYKNPSDRRFHAQTTCCRDCGPSYVLMDRQGDILESNEEIIIKRTQKLLNEGKIIAIKGIGGTHLVCRADEEKIISRIRSVKGDRLRKPFALMSYSLEDIRKFAKIPSNQIEKLLKSPRRPIVLLEKAHIFPLAENVAPNLHNVGVMLPYSGFHYQLLNNDQYPNLRTLVMTSANKSHSPIEIKSNEILENLGNVADFFVIHNREIYQRIDDSVIKPMNILGGKIQTDLFIRRSRGYVPEPISIPFFNFNQLLLGLGSEMHTTPTLLSNGKLFFTQYTGNIRYEKNFQFYKSSINHLQRLLGHESIYAASHDLHPLYLSTEYANELTKTQNIKTMSFQHHFSHAASLLVDNGLWNEKAIVVTADGLGLGTDNAVWGGEILGCDLNSFERLDHLKYVPQPGGDIATKYPERMLISYLYASNWSESEIIDVVSEKSSKIVTNVYRQIQNNINTHITSSTGRFLDTCSYLLGFSKNASYEGEPAIVLEGAGWGVNYLEENPLIGFAKANDIGLDFIPIIPQIHSLMKSGLKKKELAYYVQDFVGWSFATTALRYAHEKGANNIGFTGGVAFNEIILDSFSKTLDNLDKNIKILTHKRISPGDGGISGGQVALLAKKLATN